MTTIVIAAAVALVFFAIGFVAASAMASGRDEDTYRAGYSEGRAVSTPIRDLGEIERRWSDGTE